MFSFGYLWSQLSSHCIERTNQDHFSTAILYNPWIYFNRKFKLNSRNKLITFVRMGSKNLRIKLLKATPYQRYTAPTSEKYQAHLVQLNSPKQKALCTNFWGQQQAPLSCRALCKARAFLMPLGREGLPDQSCSPLAWGCLPKPSIRPPPEDNSPQLPQTPGMQWGARNVLPSLFDAEELALIKYPPFN